MHQVRRLDDQILHAIRNSAFQRLLHVVDPLAVARLDVVDNDLRRKGSADLPVWIRFRERRLDAADILCAASVEGSAEAHDKEFFLSCYAFIARIVFRRVAGIAAEVIGIRVLPFDHFFFFVGQHIPGSLCDRAHHIRIARAFLHIDRIDERCRAGRPLLTGLTGHLGNRDRNGGMFHIDLLHSGNAAETRDLSRHVREITGCLEHADPGIFVFTRHIVVRVVAGHDHERPKDDFFIAGGMYRFDHRLAGRLFRLAFHSADKDVFISEILHLGLHLAVGDLRLVGSAVSHEDESRAVRGRFRKAFVSGSGNCFGRHSHRDPFLILVDHGRIGTYFPEQRLRDHDAVELIPVCFHRLTEFIVFRTVHQVRRLDDKVLHAVRHGALERLVHVVDLLAVAGKDVVNDDLRRKSPADIPADHGLRKRRLDPADVLCPAVIEGRAEAYYQKFIFPDPVGVARIVFRGVAGIETEVVRIGELAFHQFLLRVAQRVPGGLCFGAARVGIFGPFLDIDRVDQRGDLIRLLLIRFRIRLFRRRRCFGRRFG